MSKALIDEIYFQIDMFDQGLSPSNSIHILYFICTNKKLKLILKGYV